MTQKLTAFPKSLWHECGRAPGGGRGGLEQGRR